VGAFPGKTGSPNFLHVTRPPPRHLEPPARESLLAMLQRFGPVLEVDFGFLPWAQQVRLSAAHDVMVSVHGNGLTNVLWMRPGSLVLEFFPPGSRHYEVQFFAELCGLDYFGFESDNVFPAFSRYGEPYGHHEKTNQSVPAVALDALERTLDAWIARKK
jgi:hypothetical protein